MWNALELAAAIRDRELSCVEALEACLDAVDRLDGEVNAICWRDDDAHRAAAAAADRALAAGEAVGPFHGVPVPIKDLTAVAGWPVTHGSRGASDAPSARSELCVDLLRRAGFVLAMRTNTPEFGPITAAENLRYGETRNPWDLARTPGGSSGGAAASVAAGMFPLAHGNDGGGSIRIPAAHCGLVGLKPSRGRVPRLLQSWAGGVVEGVLTRTVADTAAVLDVLAAHDPGAWYNAPPPATTYAAAAASAPAALRIGLVEAAPLGLPVDPDCVAAARAAATALEGLGHHVEPVELPDVAVQIVGPFVVLSQAGLAAYDDVDWTQAEPHNVASRRAAGGRSSLEYVTAERALAEASREVVAAWGRDFDVLLTPTTALVAPPAGSILAQVHATPDVPAVDVLRSVAFTAVFNVTGQPAISVPAHTTADGVPVGAHLVGAPWDEDTVLALAAQLEPVLGWADRRPPLAARS